MCNTADLELFRQRLDDESYMCKIIDDIKDKNCSILLQYLTSICANTQWAPSLQDTLAHSAYSQHVSGEMWVLYGMTCTECNTALD